MSFYRIYRPQIIDEIDNERVRGQLATLLVKDKASLPHAYLLTGPKGSGKTTTARLIAKLFNCQKPTKKSEPCGACGQCTSIAKGINLDVLELDAASNRGIDEIRQIKEGISLAPSSSAYKVFIIDEVHMLTTEAFNALLKTLEEPPAHAIFVLATTEAGKVPVTIRSRCTLIPFAKARLSEVVRALERIVKQEKLKVDDGVLDFIASHTEGSFRDAVKTLEQVSLEGKRISLESVTALLTPTDDATIDELITHVHARRAKEAVAMIEACVNDGKDVRQLLSSTLVRLKDALVTLAKNESESGWRFSDLSRLIALLTDAYGYTKGSPVIQLPLELAILAYCYDVQKQASTGLVQQPVASVSSPRTIQQAKPVQTSPPPPLAPIDEEPDRTGLVTIDKLVEHWKDIIEEVKPFNHSLSGVLRSSRPKGVDDGIVTLEAFYPFHKERLSEVRAKQVLATVIKKLFGERVKVEIVLGKK